MDKAEIIFFTLIFVAVLFLSLDIYLLIRHRKTGSFSTWRLSHSTAKKLLIILNILAGFAGLVGLAYLFILPAKIQSLSVADAGVWEDYDQPYSINLDRPTLLGKQEVKFDNELKGEWRREKANMLDIFSRRMAFYPEQSLLPDEIVKAKFSSTSIIPIGQLTNVYEFSFSSGSKSPSLNINEEINNKQNVDPRQVLEFTVENANRESYVLDFQSEPPIEYEIEEEDNFKIRLKPVHEYKNDQSYVVKILATPVSYNLKTKEVLKKGEVVELGNVEFKVAPTPNIVSAEPNGDMVLSSEQIKFTFDAEMNKESFEKGFKIDPEVKGSWEWNEDFTEVLYKPEAALQKETKYTITLSKNIRSKYGARLEQDLAQNISDITEDFVAGPTITFTTIGSVGVVAVSPTPNSTGISPSANISITFNQDVDRASAESRFTISPDVVGKYVWEGNRVLTFDPNSNLPFSQRFTVSIAAGIKSIDGLDLKTNYSFSFSIKADRFELSNFPAYYQNNYGYPFGCNITAAAMAVTYKGVAVTPPGFYSAIAKQNVPQTLGPDGRPTYWGDPNQGFVGNVAGSPGTFQGYGVYWNPVANTINGYLGSGRAAVYRNYNVTDLLKEVEKGNPAILWWQNGASSPTPLSWNSPTGVVTGVNGMHSEVVIGYVGSPENPSSIITQDPWRGRRVIPISTFNSLWSYYSRTAVVVR